MTIAVYSGDEFIDVMSSAREFAERWGYSERVAGVMISKAKSGARRGFISDGRHYQIYVYKD